MYKDPDKQRDAVKLATRRYRVRQGRRLPRGITSQAHKVSQQSGTSRVSQANPVIPRQEAAQSQSYNPMMVGYVPPQE